jgi:GxxExxY protein
MDTDGGEASRLTERVIGCSFRVANTLGPGFLEAVYQRALAHELAKSRLAVVQQHRIAVHYDGIVVGEYTADILVENTLLLELKSVRALDNNHCAQCQNYLKATGLRLCLLLNFGRPRLEIRRIIDGI